MEAIFFLVTVAGILLVIHWAVTNDAAGNRKPTKGLFALRRTAKKPKDKPRPPRG